MVNAGIRAKLLASMLVIGAATMIPLVLLGLSDYGDMAGQYLAPRSGRAPASNTMQDEGLPTGTHILKRLLSMYIGSLLIFTLAGIYLVNRLLLKPIKDLTLASRQLAQGNYHIRLPATRHDEMGLLTESFSVLHNNLLATLQSHERESIALNGMLVALQENEARTKGIFNSVQDGLIMSSGLGIIAAVNPALCEMTGYRENELVNHNVDMLVPLSFRSRHQQYLVDFTLETDHQRRGYIQVDALHKSGQHIPVEISLSQLNSNGEHYIIGVVHDISERLQAERALRYERDRAQCYLDTAEVAIVTIDTAGRITLANRKCCVLLGYSEAELLGMDYFSLCPDQAVAAEMRAAYLHHVTSNDDFPKFFYINLLTRDGQTRIFEWHNNTVKDYEWNTAGVILAGADITEFRKSLDERNALRDRLHQAQKMQAVGQLSSGIAHDFNNILASIMGYTELLQDILAASDDESVTNYLKEIYVSGERARDLVEGMLKYSRNAGRMGPSSSNTLNITGMTDDIAKLLHSILPGGIDVTIDIPQSAWPIAMDSINLQQLIMNLSLNASEAMRNTGHLTICCVNTDNYHGICTSCGKSYNGDYLELTFTDTGCGIDCEAITRLFEPFYTSKTVGEAGKATGMGLAVVHGIIHETGGHIRVVSKPGVGTNVNVFIPAATGQPLALEAGA